MSLRKSREHKYKELELLLREELGEPWFAKVASKASAVARDGLGDGWGRRRRKKSSFLAKLNAKVKKVVPPKAFSKVKRGRRRRKKSSLFAKLVAKVKKVVPPKAFSKVK